MRLAVASHSKIIRQKKSATPLKFKDAMAVFDKIARELGNGQSWEGAAGCVPGPLDAKLTKMVSAPNLPLWNGRPLKRTLEKILQCPVKLIKDVSAAVLGEANYGAGKGQRIVVYFTVSTGVGGAGRLTAAWTKRRPGPNRVIRSLSPTTRMVLSRGWFQEPV